MTAEMEGGILRELYEKMGMIEVIATDVKDMKVDQKEIKEQTTRTNGRVSLLEAQIKVLERDKEKFENECNTRLQALSEQSQKIRDDRLKLTGMTILVAFLLGISPFAYTLYRDSRKQSRTSETSITQEQIQNAVEYGIQKYTLKSKN